MWLSGWTSYKVSHERAKFGDYGQFGSGDVMVLTSGNLARPSDLKVE